MQCYRDLIILGIPAGKGEIEFFTIKAGRGRELSLWLVKARRACIRPIEHLNIEVSSNIFFCFVNVFEGFWWKFELLLSDADVID